MLKSNKQIPQADLKISAQKSLTALQIWFLGTQYAIKRQHNPSPEIASLVTACQKLRKNGYRNGRGRLAENNILKRHVQSMIEDLTDNSLKIFALLNWHFNADFSSASFPSASSILRLPLQNIWRCVQWYPCHIHHNGQTGVSEEL